MNWEFAGGIVAGSKNRLWSSITSKVVGLSVLLGVERANLGGGGKFIVFV
jgi:hypothetical protein